MKIIEMEIENFRPFYGKRKMILNASDTKTFNIFYAVSGSGKTTILDALTWCVYGEETQKQNQEKRILNEKKEDELKSDDMASVSVSITLGESEKKPSVFLKRTIDYIKQGNAIKQIGGEQKIARILDERENMIDADMGVVVNQVFPKEMNHLFMFNGEGLITFFDGNNSDKVKNAIRNITQLDYLEKVISRLEKLLKEYKPTEKTTKTDDMNAIINGHEVKIDELKKEKEVFEKEIKKLKEEKEIVSNKILKSNISKDSKNIYEKIKKTRDIINKEKERLVKIKDEKFEYLLSSLPTIFCKKDLEEALGLINKDYESENIPPKIKSEFIKFLLKEETCICGTHLPKGSKERSLVEKQDKPISDYSGELVGLKTQINNMITDFKDFNKSRKDYSNEINQCEETIKNLNSTLELSEKELPKISEEEVNSLFSRENSIIQDIERFNRDLGNNDKSIEYYSSQLLNKKTELRKEEEKLIEDKETREKWDILSNSITLLEEIKNNLLIKMKEEVSKRINKLFLDCTKEAMVSKIEIDNNFQCRVLNRDDENYYESLSSGQKQVLATSFMISLRKESGFSSPILMDFPLARIDRKKRKELIDALKKLLENTQILLFLIEETEFSDFERNCIGEKLGRLIQIRKIENEKRSVIEVKE